MRISALVLCIAIGFIILAPGITFGSQSSASRGSQGKAVEIGAVTVQNLPNVQDGQASSLKTIPNFTPSSVSLNSQSVAKGSSISPTTPGVTVSTNLNGVFGGAPNPCGCTPPDPNLGVGPKHVFMMANIAGIIYNTDGTIAKNTFSLADFFKVSVANEIGDPEVMFDSASNRWFASSITAPNNVEFAVSTTSDPTGTFVLYTVSGGSIFPDQPFIATNNDKFVISVNAFTTKFVGAEFWVFNKSELVAGQSTIDFTLVGPNSSLFSAHPARHLTSTTNFYLVSIAFGSADVATVLTVTGVPPNPVGVTSTTVAVNHIDNPPRATQPTTGTKLVTNDDRVLSAVWESNLLWFSLTNACVPSGDSMIRSCARLVELSTANGGIAKLQDFDLAMSNTYLFYPALSLNQGNVVLVFGESSQTVFPSLLATGRLATDPVGTLKVPVMIRSGTQDDESTRYGDYFGAATSPQGNFWVAGEYRIDETFQNWSTAIAQVQIS